MIGTGCFSFVVGSIQKKSEVLRNLKNQPLQLTVPGVFNSEHLGVNTPKKFQPICPNFKTWTSQRPNQTTSYYVYLSIINCDLTSESVLECFFSQITSVDCRVSAYFISYKRATTTALL